MRTKKACSNENLKIIRKFFKPDRESKKKRLMFQKCMAYSIIFPHHKSCLCIHAFSQQTQRYRCKCCFSTNISVVLYSTISPTCTLHINHRKKWGMSTFTFAASSLLILRPPKSALSLARFESKAGQNATFIICSLWRAINLVPRSFIAFILMDYAAFCMPLPPPFPQPKKGDHPDLGHGQKNIIL